MKIIIMHQTITSHDAIGNDIEAMYRILSKIQATFVFAEYKFNKELRYLTEKQVEEYAADPNNLLIYHHSVFWERGEAILRMAKARIIIRYHNITPPDFFAPFNFYHESQCRLGREQTERLEEELPTAKWLCDSGYNALDISAYEEENVAVCAPFHKIETWSQGVPDEKIMEKLLYSSSIELLSVGRIAPNKGHLFMLDVLQSFRLNYRDNIHLWIIGKFDEALHGYNEQIKERICQYGLEEQVSFVGEINDESMSAYYLGCDFLLCASEHEGFCVPLEEAQYFKLPVIARRSSAIGETLGPEQIILGEDIREYAAAIHVLYHNEQYLDWLRKKGRENYDGRFTYEQLRKRFLRKLMEWNVLST